MKKYVIKRKGHLEVFDERKVYASCYAACLNASLTKYEAEKICEGVTKKIRSWIVKRKKATSDDIFKEIIKAMKKFNEDASFMYETHRDVN